MACTFAFSPLLAERDTLRVYFDAGAEEVSSFQQTLIDIFLQTHYATGEVIVAGHTDDQGTAVSNLLHSKERAQWIAAYLVGKGMKANQLVVEAWGETKPLLPNSNDFNRARNRRVELIGIPNPTTQEDVRPLANGQILLRDGTAIPYREMTTPDGKPKRVWVIHLEKEDEGLLGYTLTVGSSSSPVITLPDCFSRTTFRFQIPTTAAQRCPIDQVWFDEGQYNVTKTSSWMDKQTLKPMKTDSGYFFVLDLADLRNCYLPTYSLGEGCYTLHEAKIRLDRVRAHDFRVAIPQIDDRQTPQIKADGTYNISYINEDPSTTKINAVLFKNKLRKVYLKDVALSKLRYDSLANEYVIDGKALKWLRKQSPKTPAGR